MLKARALKARSVLRAEAEGWSVLTGCERETGRLPGGGRWGAGPLM
jgi:hypothetical protein